MENKTATFTFFTLLLLYTVSAARPTVNSPVTNPTSVKTDDASKLPKYSDRSKILLPGEKILHPEPEKPTNDLAPHTNFSRFHPINRHFHVRPHRAGPQQTGAHRRPCLKHKQNMIPFPPVKNSCRNDKVAAERTDVSRTKSFRGEVPANWLKAKHHYGNRWEHNSNQKHDSQNNKKDNNNINVMKTKNVFDREKMKSLNRQLKQKKSVDHKAGVMKNIRKFLKHTFD